MTLIKLKDVNIDNIIDDIQDYSVWGGTFNDSTNTQMSNFILELEDGRTIELKSIDLDQYSEPFGIHSATEFVMDVLRLVTSGEARSYTLTDFILWIVDNYVEGGIEITVSKCKSITKTGFIERKLDEFYPSFIVDYVKHGINKNYNFSKRYDYSFLIGEAQDLNLEQNEVLALSLSKIPEDSAVKVISLQEFLSA